MTGGPRCTRLQRNHAWLSLGPDGPSNHLMRLSSTTLPANCGHQRKRCCRPKAESKSLRSSIATRGTSVSACSMKRTASRPLQPIRKDLVIRFRRQRLAKEAIMAAKEISVKKYVVRLSGEERERLETLLRKGKSPARRVLKARILLKADVSEAGKGWSDNRIIEALETSPSMVYRVRKQLVEEGFE